MSYQESFLKADINVTTIGDNTIIAAPNAGQYIAIDHINFLPASQVTIQLKDGTTNYGGAYPINSTNISPILFENSEGNEHGIITLSPGNAFVMNLNAAVQVSGFVRYRIIGD